MPPARKISTLPMKLCVWKMSVSKINDDGQARREKPIYHAGPNEAEECFQTVGFKAVSLTAVHVVDGGEAEAREIGDIDICNNFVCLIPWHPKEDFAAGKFKILEKCGQKHCGNVSRDSECRSVLQMLLNKECLDREGSEEYDDTLAYFRVEAAVDDNGTDCGDEHDASQGYGILSEDTGDF